MLTVTNDYPDPVRHEWRLMAEARLRNPAVPAKELAAALGYNYHTILAWSRNPAYQRYENFVIKKEMDNIPPSAMPRKSVRDVLTEYEVNMAERLIDICESTKDEKLAADIAQDLLDRAGHAPKSREGARPIILNLGNDVIGMFQQRAREAGLVIDADGNSLPESV